MRAVVSFIPCVVFAIPLLTSDGSAASTTPELTTEPGQSIETHITVRVVAHGAMVVGDAVGGARVTITDVATGQILATGIQTGEAGDQNLIMRTPRLMDEPLYASSYSGAFQATLTLDRPTLVEVAAQGPLAYPAAMQRASQTLLLLPGQDVISDGVILHLYGYLVQITWPSPGTPLMAKDDVTLKASVRTLSGSLVRPHGDWDSRKMNIHGEVLIGGRVVERLQLFYSGSDSVFEAPFFVPQPQEAPDGVTVRVVAADGAGANFGLGEAHYPIVPEQVKRKHH